MIEVVQFLHQPRELPPWYSGQQRKRKASKKGLPEHGLLSGRACSNVELLKNVVVVVVVMVEGRQVDGVEEILDIDLLSP